MCYNERIEYCILSMCSKRKALMEIGFNRFSSGLFYVFRYLRLPQLIVTKRKLCKKPFPLFAEFHTLYKTNYSIRGRYMQEIFAKISTNILESRL